MQAKGLACLQSIVFESPAKFRSDASVPNLRRLQEWPAEVSCFQKFCMELYKPSETGWGVEKIAAAWNELMLRLGYDQYFAQGGDWGSAVCSFRSPPLDLIFIYLINEFIFWLSPCTRKPIFEGRTSRFHFLGTMTLRFNFVKLGWHNYCLIQGVPSIGTHFQFQFLTFLIVLSKKCNSAILTQMV